MIIKRVNMFEIFRIVFGIGRCFYILLINISLRFILICFQQEGDSDSCIVFFFLDFFSSVVVDSFFQEESCQEMWWFGWFSGFFLRFSFRVQDKER